MDLSIIIVNWNVKELLEKALSSLEKYPTRKYSMETIVVDNASKDSSVEMVKTKFPKVKLMASPKNLGFAAGNNLGYTQATGSIILCLNPDTEIFAETLDFIVDAFQANPKLGALGVKLLNADGTLQPSCKSFPNVDTIIYNSLFLDVLFPKSKIFGKYNMSWFAHDSEMDVDQPMGAALALRRTVIDQIGFFDEQYFMYFDEVDLCYRVKKAGWQIRFFPQVSVTHHWGQSTKQALFNMNNQWYLSFKKYLIKNYGYSSWFAAFILSIMIWLKLVLIILIFGLIISGLFCLGGLFS